MRVRTYGSSGPLVLVLHGGPGASGYMAPVARELSDGFRVLEPLQRKSGDEPLTVARHVEDLHELLRVRGVLQAPGERGRPALVGSSWGAMLALACAAAHPELAGPLVLIGCGAFDRDSRRELESTRNERMDEGLRRRIARLDEEVSDPDEMLRLLAEWLLPVDSYELASTDLEVERYDARAFEETWSDMSRLLAEGVYPKAFAAIDSPVLMLHGEHDPHPGPSIRASLAPHLRKLEYREIPRSGHYPWLERNAREEFFPVLRAWLFRHLSRSG